MARPSRARPRHDDRRRTLLKRPMKKRIFITGVSSGIGRATAELLVRHGHKVWGTSRDPARLPALAGLHPVALDLSDTAAARASFRHALAEAGYFDVVINNAGSGHFDPSATVSAEVIADQFQVLVFAQIALCQEALAAMEERGHGLIVNVSSMAARLPVPFMGAYNAAKAAFASFTMTLQIELRGSRIHVVDLQPADIRTAFNEAVRRDPDNPALAAVWEQVDRNLKAAPPPELVARRIALLVRQKHPPARVTIGGAFQATVAPLIFKLIPQGVRLWGLKKYYRM